MRVGHDVSAPAARVVCEARVSGRAARVRACGPHTPLPQGAPLRRGPGQVEERRGRARSRADRGRSRRLAIDTAFLCSSPGVPRRSTRRRSARDAQRHALAAPLRHRQSLLNAARFGIARGADSVAAGTGVAGSRELGAPTRSSIPRALATSETEAEAGVVLLPGGRCPEHQRARRSRVDGRGLRASTSDCGRSRRTRGPSATRGTRAAARESRSSTERRVSCLPSAVMKCRRSRRRPSRPPRPRVASRALRRTTAVRARQAEAQAPAPGFSAATFVSASDAAASWRICIRGVPVEW